MAFENFPYSDFHALNLDWILKRIKDLSGDVEAIRNEISAANLPEVVREELQKMLEDGTLTEIINQEVLDDVLTNQKFVPPVDETEDYREHMAEEVVSYLCNMASGTCHSIDGTPNVQTTPFLAVYCDDDHVTYADLLRYDAIVDDVSTFNRYQQNIGWTNWNPEQTGAFDTIQYGNRAMPVFYCNCIAFVMLLTKGRAYANSPYYIQFTNPNAGAKELALYALEYGDTNATPWTFDCMNLLYTWRSAECMRASGNVPFVAAYNDRTEVQYDEAIGRLEDGDLVFFGNRNNHADRYLGISHCAMYFKNLQRLNKYAAHLGVSVRAYNGATSTRGYLMHCTTSASSENRYTDVFRIESFEDYMANKQGTVCYGVKACSNALNSSKMHQNITGNLVLFDCVIKNAYRHAPPANATEIPHFTVESWREGSWNGFYSIGQYRHVQNTSITELVEGVKYLDFNKWIGSQNSGTYVVLTTRVNLLNGPTADNTNGEHPMSTPTAVTFILEVVDVTESKGYTIQTVTTTYDQNPHKYERVVNYNGKASKWMEIY